MDKLIISGKKKLKGSIKVHGAKNSALPILVSSLLSDKDLTLSNIPKVDDINNMLKLLSSLGVKIKKNKNTVKLNSSSIKNISADYDIVRKMRASILAPIDIKQFAKSTTSGSFAAFSFNVSPLAKTEDIKIFSVAPTLG